jgi:hypothetical protein
VSGEPAGDGAAHGAEPDHDRVGVCGTGRAHRLIVARPEKAATSMYQRRGRPLCLS